MRDAFLPADILLPAEKLDMTRWSVIACDQYTSEPDYWDQVKDIAGEAPSALSMIFPEVYLEDGDMEDRLARIHHSMKEYMSRGVFREYKDSMIYVRRIDSSGNLREGLVGKIDLDCYEYEKGSHSMVRATEETVPGRLPPRVHIRENADLELPHVIMLIDDIDQMVIEPLGRDLPGMEKVYDFDLMLGGGHLSGYLLDEGQKERVRDGLRKLDDPAWYKKRYSLEDEKPMIFAVGDGNHSLASAKAYYEKLKEENPGLDLSDHPARYALVELVNLHSPSLDFEPIYRIVTRVNPRHLMEKMIEEMDLHQEGQGQSFEMVFADASDQKTSDQGMPDGMTSDQNQSDGKASDQDMPDGKAPDQDRPDRDIHHEDLQRKIFVIGKPVSELAVGSLQAFLDDYTGRYGGKIDYIHGEETVLSLSRREGTVGFLLPTMHKNELFSAVMADGALPRKTFSMGHARDKRYYTECRRIKTEEE